MKTSIPSFMDLALRIFYERLSAGNEPERDHPLSEVTNTPLNSEHWQELLELLKGQEISYFEVDPQLDEDSKKKGLRIKTKNNISVILILGNYDGGGWKYDHLVWLHHGSHRFCF